MDFLDKFFNFLRGSNNQSEPEPLFVLSIREKTFADSIRKEPDLAYIDDFISDQIEAKNLSYKRFTELMIDAYKKALPTAEISSLPDGGISIKFESGDTWENYLDNAWTDCKTEPGSRKLLLRHRIANVLSSMQFTEEIDLNCLVPLIRNYGSPLNVDVEGQLSAVGKAVAPGLDIVLGLDSERGIQTLTISQFNETGQDLEALIQLSKQNLLDTVLPPAVDVYPGRFSKWMIVCDGTYESSLILLDEVMAFLQREAGAKLIFAVPSRDLLMCSPHTEQAIKLMNGDLTKTYSQLSYQISPNIYSWDKGAIEIVVDNSKKKH